MWIKPRTSLVSLEILGALSDRCLALAEDEGILSSCQDWSNISSLVGSRDYLGLINYELDYERCENEHASPEVLFYLRQILAFFSKLDFLDLGFDRKIAAAQKFIEAEQQCLDTNRKLEFHARRPNNIPSFCHTIHFRMIGKIAAILGNVPPIEKLECCFGPGANTSVKGAQASPRVKLSAPLECSNELYSSGILDEVLNSVPHWTQLHAVQSDDEIDLVSVNVVPGKVVFVPKTAKIDRTICVEPILNSFLQKGIGTYIRDRLALYGVDLNSQSKNQHLAMRGSVFGDLATIDLSSASDCISRELVWNLLPFPWAELLDNVRTGDVTLPKEFGEFGRTDVHLQKFSSMGNAYTFELESLIFWAISSSVYEEVFQRSLPLRQEVVSVYGDDIIVPVECFELTRAVLEYYGFSLNKKKSFSSGPFRESCGADYYKGSFIRPFYQKTLVSDRTLFSMHNFFIRSGEPRLASAVKEFIHPATILYGPDGAGDGHLIGSHSLRCSRKDRRRGFEGGYFDTYTLKPRFYRRCLPGDAILPVYSVYVRSGMDSPTDPFVVRGTRGYTKITIYTLSTHIFMRT